MGAIVAIIGLELARRSSVSMSGLIGNQDFRVLVVVVFLSLCSLVVTSAARKRRETR